MQAFDKLWNYNDPAATEIKFRDYLADSNAGLTQSDKLELRSQIARTLGLQQKYDEAHLVLDNVEAELNADFQIATLRYLLERGRVFNSAGKQIESIPFFLKAWELGQEFGADFFAVDAAHMLGIAEASPEQLAWNEKAMELAENSEDSRAKGWLGSLYNNIGWTQHDLGNYEKALVLFEKGLAWQESNSKVRETQIAKWTVARTQRSLGNIDLSLKLQLELEQEILESGSAEDGYVSEEIAECLSLKGQHKAATPHFFKAWKLLSEDLWLQQNEAERLSRLKELGEHSPE
ncbi:MAG: hypothetical protein HQ507_08365 [Candidatus Marinimicrobia bacterium]|nr:hypothetical protein [Candidatus Neomarinimicrobiota bacterium]